jgi:hypothetical protein
MTAERCSVSKETKSSGIIINRTKTKFSRDLHGKSKDKITRKMFYCRINGIPFPRNLITALSESVDDFV